MKKGFLLKKENTPEISSGNSETIIDGLRKQLSEYLHVKNDMEKAEKLCSEILNINPYLPEYILKRALIRENLGKDNDALKDAALYQYMYPFNLEALSTQARLLQKLGQYESAMRVLKLLMVFDKDELLQEEYEKVAALRKKSKKKHKKKSESSKSNEQQQQAESKNSLIQEKTEATVDESGCIILEEEKIGNKTNIKQFGTSKTPCGIFVNFYLLLYRGL